jgi:hypothetical protein
VYHWVTDSFVKSMWRLLTTVRMPMSRLHWRLQQV